MKLYTERASCEVGVFQCCWLTYPEDSPDFEFWFHHRERNHHTEVSLTYEEAQHLYHQLKAKLEPSGI